MDNIGYNFRPKPFRGWMRTHFRLMLLSAFSLPAIETIGLKKKYSDFISLLFYYFFFLSSILNNSEKRNSDNACILCITAAAGTELADAYSPDTVIVSSPGKEVHDS
ncbi:uncharacterized protein LOC120082816 [Benincasa hispida]|uniref:uncharacterized protein LOC120082816 n=1 Tax=Benincasa hispida TaxID=102211 RepID=UPI001902A31D|nr:uncharacterized protein LOC120082816 [Benincasa hispida]